MQSFCGICSQKSIHYGQSNSKRHKTDFQNSACTEQNNGELADRFIYAAGLTPLSCT